MAALRTSLTCDTNQTGVAFLTYKLRLICVFHESVLHLPSTTEFGTRLIYHSAISFTPQIKRISSVLVFFISSIFFFTSSISIYAHRFLSSEWWSWCNVFLLMLFLASQHKHLEVAHSSESVSMSLPLFLYIWSFTLEFPSLATWNSSDTIPEHWKVAGC